MWEDNDYGLIRWKQEIGFGRHSHTEFNNPDLVKICRGPSAATRGGWAAPTSCGPALKEALSTAATSRRSSWCRWTTRENVKLTKRLGQLIAR